MRDLSRLLRPKSVAVLGGAWAENVVAQLQKTGYHGAIWPVHPTRTSMRGIACRPDLAALPGAPDAAFVGVNRLASIDAVARLAVMGAGGAIAFAAGFRESGGDGAALQDRLVAAAGDMPLLGPNCYGLLNYLDRVTLWPDQHGGLPVETGVAIVAQSSNVAINMTMQRRCLPLAYVVCAGNQAQTGLAGIAMALIADPRVSAIGLHIEGFGDVPAFEAMAAAAHAAGKPVVVLKCGRSSAACAAALSHTASLAGSAAVSSAFLRRLGVAEVGSPAALLETLKLLHSGGPLRGSAVVSVSCSGGEAGLMADGADGTRLDLRPLTGAARAALGAALGPDVAVANPLDYHTFVWGDVPRMTTAFAAVLADGFDLAVFVLDLPRADRCDPAGYFCAIEAILAACAATGGRAAVLAILPENLDEAMSARFLAEGITPLHGLTEGLAAIDAAIRAGAAVPPPVEPALLGAPDQGTGEILTEAAAKAALAAFGLAVPRGVVAPDADTLADAARDLRFPVALKTLGVAHKTEAGAVVLGLPDAAALRAAASRMPPGDGLLAEEMVLDHVAELIVGVVVDTTGLVALTLGAGGVLAELLEDTATLILPTDAAAVRAAIGSLRIAHLLGGYRGRPCADMTAVIDAVLAVARYAQANAAGLVELDVNPLMACPDHAIAVDALIRLRGARR